MLTQPTRAPAVGLDAAGNGFAVWTQSDGGEANILVSRYE